MTTGHKKNNKQSKHKKRHIVGLLTVLFFAVILIEGILSNTMIGLTHYTISSEQIPESFEGYRIALIGDLHSKEFGDDNAYLIKKLNQTDADIIVLCGDMVNSWDSQFDSLYALAEQLVGICPTYYIVGNHEQNLNSSVRAEMLRRLESVGITILDNEMVLLQENSDTIELYGMWFNLRYYKDVTEENQEDIHFGIDQMTRVLGDADTAYQILLTHNPVYFETYAEWGADLTLSGHIHGGMIRIPFVGGMFSPEIEMFPEYDAGRYEIDDSMMIVNRGLGNGVFRFRWGNHPEISVITLETK